MIEKKIFFIREEKVMLDSDLATLYNVPTKVFNQAVKRNKKRFPEGFMFQLNSKELESLRSQFVTSKNSRGGQRYLPYAFTEHGVAMLSSILNSDRAIQVNIQIIKTFIQLRKLAVTNKDIHKRIDDLENKYAQQFQIVFQTLEQLLDGPQKIKKIRGFVPQK